MRRANPWPLLRCDAMPPRPLVAAAGKKKLKDYQVLDVLEEKVCRWAVGCGMGVGTCSCPSTNATSCRSSGEEVSSVSAFPS